MPSGPAAPRRPGDPLDGGPGSGPGHRPEEEPAPSAAAAPIAAPRRSGRPCPRCRADNSADRNLCVRCGGLLETGAGPDASPLPWWRRLFRRRSDRVLEAGSRPRTRTWPRPRLALPLTLLVLAAAAWFARSQLDDVFSFTQDRTGKLEALRPKESRASSEASGHRAGAAFDGFNNRYWAPAEAGPGVGQYLEAEFEEPVRLRKVLITPGSSAKQDEFLLQARPAELTVTLFSADGKRTTEAVNLKDQPGQQTFDVRGSDVVRVRLTADAAFGARSQRRLAIAEVEFFGRR
ncbi:discoidin domain-containing protein [Streptomyces sp. P1-3]|uniref:discoidin domain-containing protein n=1 Tax=Streptomyces sp. P1-3 TaxID=3421658 RepID=UPI003D367E36